MGKSSLLVVALLCIALAHAQGIVLQSPADGGSMQGGQQLFIFLADAQSQYETLAQCSLIVDEEIVKTLAINAKLAGQSRQFSGTLSPGTYQWSISCETEEGATLTSGPRIVTVLEAEENPVKVEPSGSVRGSFLHEFSMKSTAAQRPVTVPGIAPGDYIGVTVEIAPSKITREFYYKGRIAREDKTFVRLTSEGDEFELPQGEEMTLPVGSASVIATFTEIDGSRATIVFAPSVRAQEPAQGEGSQPEEQPAEELPAEEEQESQEETPAEPPEQPPEEQQAPTQPSGEDTPAQPAAPEQEAPKQGILSRMLSWLAKVFGT